MHVQGDVRGVARPQLMPSHNMGTLHLREHAFPEFSAFQGSFRPYYRLELGSCLWYKPVCSVKSLYCLQQTRIHQGSISNLVVLRIQIAILCSSISTASCIFSGRFVIESDIAGNNNCHACLHWWGTATCC